MLFRSGCLARTAGVKMGIGPDNRLCIAHVVKDQVNAAGVERLLGSTAAADGRSVIGSIPQDPGSAGKSWALHLLKHALMGYSYTASPETGDKETRAMPLAAQVEAGNVDIVAGDWNGEFLDEAATFRWVSSKTKLMPRHARLICWRAQTIHGLERYEYHGRPAQHRRQ